MLFYPAALPLSRQTLDYTARIIRRHRRQIGSPWRKLNSGQQALLVLAYLRKGETFAELAAGFGVDTATAWRYVTETVMPFPAGTRAEGLGQRSRRPLTAQNQGVERHGSLSRACTWRRLMAVTGTGRQRLCPGAKRGGR
jgi:Helix-turn-helix of DDE superfamily endonuclease